MSAAAEAARQQALLQALRAPQGYLPVAAVALPGRGASRVDGVQAYRANAQAVAERALAAAYPVLAQLLGQEAMAALARDLWRDHPPQRGDLGWFGAELAEWLPSLAELADIPYLADVARLEWAVHRAHSAADPADAPLDLQALAGADPEALRFHFVAGSACVVSRWPVLTLWRAHQVAADQPPELEPVRGALAEGRAETAWIWRRGHRIELAALSDAERDFSADLQRCTALGAALAAALERDPEFSFEQWLTRALREGWLAEIETTNRS
ncbi:MAG TPA: putative DNA-binding domain-containing protein [Ideonella sp.]|nr:putative DNA-binding domain-containing protein [Ideonella sp.]